MRCCNPGSDHQRLCAVCYASVCSCISCMFQFNAQLSLQPDALSTQFSHMTLAQQPPSDGGSSAPDGRHYSSVYHHHHHPSPVMLQGAPPQQVASYIMAGPSGGHPGVLQGQPVPLPTPGPNHAYPNSTPGPAAFPGPALNQPLLQQHTYIQQPVQQVEQKARRLLRSVSECANLSS